MYYGKAEFVITWGAADQEDRFYACPGCRALVDAGEWPGLIAYAGLWPTGARGVRGFRDHHTPGAVTPPGTPFPGRPETATRPAARRRAVRAAQGCDLRW